MNLEILENLEIWNKTRRSRSFFFAQIRCFLLTGGPLGCTYLYSPILPRFRPSCLTVYRTDGGIDERRREGNDVSRSDKRNFSEPESRIAAASRAWDGGATGRHAESAPAGRGGGVGAVPEMSHVEFNGRYDDSAAVGRGSYYGKSLGAPVPLPSSVSAAVTGDEVGAGGGGGGGAGVAGSVEGLRGAEACRTADERQLAAVPGGRGGGGRELGGLDSFSVQAMLLHISSINSIENPRWTRKKCTEYIILLCLHTRFDHDWHFPPVIRGGWQSSEPAN